MSAARDAPAMPRAPRCLFALMLILPVPLVFGADDCGARDSITERVLCRADDAVAADSSAPCDTAHDARVRDQCYGVFAVRTGSASACRSIPGDTERADRLRQICLSDVAIVTGNGALCAEIADDGLHDACHLKLHRDTGNEALCRRIRGEALRRLCGSTDPG